MGTYISKHEKKFKSISYIIEHSNSILLFAHSNPDPDTVGSVYALYLYLKEKNKHVDIACLDSFPLYLTPVFTTQFHHPSELELQSYDSVIACDSVERGFDTISNTLHENQAVVLIDHHANLTLKGDVTLIDPSYSSTCEILYEYFKYTHHKINRDLATTLLLGILADTGNLQHANTTIDVLDATSDLLKKGASLHKISDVLSSNNNISTLKLWGKALDKARFNNETGMIVTALTKQDMQECEATTDKVSQIAAILVSVPDVKYALVLSQKSESTIRGSLRALKYAGIDVSKIANIFGGGGHPLASGFELKGVLKEDSTGWLVV
jgi:phosphoesterase RecJ-like protein